MIAPELLAILVCPVCKGGLHPDDGRSSLVCPACALSYPVRDGIPVMLPDQATRLTGNGPEMEGS